MGLARRLALTALVTSISILPGAADGQPASGVTVITTSEASSGNGEVTALGGLSLPAQQGQITTTSPPVLGMPGNSLNGAAANTGPVPAAVVPSSGTVPACKLPSAFPQGVVGATAKCAPNAILQPGESCPVKCAPNTSPPPGSTATTSQYLCQTDGKLRAPSFAFFCSPNGCAAAQRPTSPGQWVCDKKPTSAGLVPHGAVCTRACATGQYGAALTSMCSFGQWSGPAAPTCSACTPIANSRGGINCTSALNSKAGEKFSCNPGFFLVRGQADSCRAAPCPANSNAVGYPSSPSCVCRSPTYAGAISWNGTAWAGSCINCRCVYGGVCQANGKCTCAAAFIGDRCEEQKCPVSMSAYGPTGGASIDMGGYTYTPYPGGYKPCVGCYRRTNETKVDDCVAECSTDQYCFLFTWSQRTGECAIYSDWAVQELALIRDPDVTVVYSTPPDPKTGGKYYCVQSSQCEILQKEQ